MIVFLSWIGSIFLLLRSIPQACKSWREGHSEGITASMLWLWLFGSILVLPALIMSQQWATVVIYIVNVITNLVMLKYLYFPRKIE